MTFSISETKNSTPSKKKPKPKRRDKTDHGEDFVPPDGGWAWIICLASGFSNLCSFPILQQFGIIFRDRLLIIGLTNSQITTLINVNCALSALTGLVNGPVFRRFSYRQVAFFGSSLFAMACFFASAANSFITYLLTYSILYGIGMGLNISATSLVLNTYFKNKRRKATAFAWTATGIGPIIMPFIATGLLECYGVQGTVMIFSAFCLNSVACALAFQPVKWHVKKKEPNEEPEHLCAYCRSRKRKNTGIFSSQYLFNSDDIENPGYEITDPGTPMLSRCNDGWFSNATERYGSKASLASIRGMTSRNTSFVNMKERKGSILLSKEVLVEEGEISLDSDKSETNETNKTPQITPLPEVETLLKSNPFNFEKENLKLSFNQSNLNNKNNLLSCTCQEEQELELKIKADELQKKIEDEEARRKNMTILQKIFLFFDLDLLKDGSYVNLMIGLTIANFAEINFSILTPFILNDFGYTNEQIALLMSLLAAMDLIVRFLTPFFAERIGWENKTFFMIGIGSLALGRIVIAHVRYFPIIVVTHAWLGLAKGFRTIFMALIIPSYVPLNRLPAASGLQLVCLGLVSLSAGPLIGFAKDYASYTVTLHCINIFTFTTIIAWTAENIYHLHQNKKRARSPSTT